MNTLNVKIRRIGWHRIMTRLFGMMLMVLSACETTPGPAPSYMKEFTVTEVTLDYSNAFRPLLVAELDSQARAAAVGSSQLSRIGGALGIVNENDVQFTFEQAITANTIPHIRDALNPLFTGQRPARAIVEVRSVFIRSRFGLQQLTGAEVFINGEKRPDNPQYVGRLSIQDIETGLVIEQTQLITKTDDGAVTIAGGGPTPPDYGPAKRLNKLAFEFAQEAAKEIVRNPGGDSSFFDQF